LDPNTHYLTSYASGLTVEDLPAEVIHKTKGLLIDTVACAMGGYTSEPAIIARRMAERVSPRHLPATMLGSGKTSSPELATTGVCARIPGADATRHATATSRVPHARRVS